MGVIKFHSTVLSYKLSSKNTLKKYINDKIESEGESLKVISITLCSDDELLQVNQQFLDHDTYTDIITFPYSLPGEPIESEIFISYDRVVENAKTFGSDVQMELHRVIFHGILHLLGYGDKTDAETKLMRGKEREYLDDYFRST